MRLITIKTPQSEGKKVAELAFQSGVKQVSFSQLTLLSKGDNETGILQDVIEIEAPTPVTKKFIESLMDAEFYKPGEFTFSIRHAESLLGKEPPEIETHPVIRPSTDVYQELWQYSKLTFSLALRVFLSALILSFGMLKMNLPLMMAGLLFLPYHHQMLTISLGACIREFNILKQGFLSLLTSTVLIFLAGICVALFTGPPVEFNEFGKPLENLLIAIVIGVAAGVASIDDAGRRELIGLAATAHIVIYPAWFGLHIIFGLPESAMVTEHILVFIMNISALILAAGITYSILKMHGKGIRKFISGLKGKVKL